MLPSTRTSLVPRCHSLVSTTIRRSRPFHSQTSPCWMAMKPGTEIPGLDIFKDKDPPVALERSEYPEWFGDLVKPLKHLADYRKMSNEEATLDDMQRYLKILRKMDIKEKNMEGKKN